MLSKTKVLVVLFLLISITISSLYIFLPNQFNSLDNRIRDFYFLFRGPQKTDENIVIVDIDERSIKELGQWPWERKKLAKILQNLTDNGAGIIGLDIVFSEQDKTSPKLFAAQFGADVNSAEDYDLIFAQTVASTPTILGYQFDFDNSNSNDAPQIPAIFVEKHKQDQEFLLQAKGVLTNLKIIQDAGYSSGYMNNIPDESGMIRSVPLLIKYDNVLYPSLAFEMFRIASNAHKVTLSYSNAGVESLRVGKTQISTDRFARLHINFRGPFKSYKYISAIDVYNNSVDSKFINGKIILIGTSAYGLMDLRSTPMDSVIAGVEVHANLIDNLIHNDMLTKPILEELITIATILISVFIIIFIFSRFSMFYLFIAYTLSIYMMFYINYYFLFTKYLILNTVFPLLSIVASLIAILGVKYIFEFRYKELVKNSFSKKVSKQVMDDLLLNPQDTNLSAKELETTIYFSDIRSFTTISEELKSPKRITEFLNFYMDNMVIPIEQNQGTIDKFIGDAIMAYWNAPLPVANHADKAVVTALFQIAQRDLLNQTISRDFGFDVDYGIGINTGDVVVGEIGSKGRSDYTIIGDAVNLASRLEGLCKPYKVRLVISEFTKERLTQPYVIQLLDIVRVKGKHEPVKIYEVLSNGMANRAKKIELELFNTAHKLYMQANFIEAKEQFITLHKTYNKYLYDLYTQRCLLLIEEKVEEFDGVFEFTTK
jgi:adenylate cyclase